MNTQLSASFTATDATVIQSGGPAHTDGELPDHLEPQARQQARGECGEHQACALGDIGVLAEPHQRMTESDQHCGSGHSGDGGQQQTGTDDVADLADTAAAAVPAWARAAATWLLTAVTRSPRTPPWSLVGS
jgi:hypothetical protein